MMLQCFNTNTITDLALQEQTYKISTKHYSTQATQVHVLGP